MEELERGLEGLRLYDYLQLVEEAKRLLRPGLIRLEGQLEALVFGDLHGDLATLRAFLHELGLPILRRGAHIVFLGDYIDRGPQQPEVLYLLLKLKAMYPERVVLLRGNHEGPPWLPVYPHDFPHRLAERFGGEAYKSYPAFVELFDRMPHACLLGDALLVHGGVPQGTTALDDLDRPSREVLEELLWNDPSEDVAWAEPSPRGAGYLFGARVTDRFLRANGLKLIVRAHEPCEGFRLNHGGRILTLFSRVGPPYFNSRAAALELVVQEGRLDLGRSQLHVLELLEPGRYGAERLVLGSLL